MDFTEKYISTVSKYEGKILTAQVDTVSIPGGGEAYREYVIHPGGVTILPLDDEGYVYCVRQFRYPVGMEVLETPAGKLEPGEEPLTCAIRELSEETGIEAEEFIDLGFFYPSPGFCRETLYIYLARGLTIGKAHLDENEFLDVERIKLETLCDMAMSDELRDAKTVIAVFKARRFLEEEANGKNGIDS